MMVIGYKGMKTLGKGEMVVSNISSLSDKLSEKAFSAKSFNSLPNDKIIDWSKLKAIVDNKITATIENFFGRGKKTM